MLGKRILSGITTLALCASIMVPTHTFAAASFTGGSNVSGGLNVQVSITDLQVTGAAPGDTVPVFLYVPAGSLSMTTTTGLTFTGASSGQRLYFSGTLTDVNAALATLKYTHSSAGTFTLEASIIEAGQIYDPSTQHIYEVVNNGSSITATAARTAATSRTINGVSGYLANITSSTENSFVAARISQDGWFGASDSGEEGTWKWLDGPESGTTFWIGNYEGQAYAYENWAGFEPNQAGDEDCSQFYANGSGWNDLSCSATNISTYIVEYGAPGNLPTVAGDTLDITLSADSTPPTITNVSSDKADGYYKAGEVIDIDVTFSEAVTSTGNVTITLETGDTDRTCTFSVSNATSGTCNYTVQAGDTSSDLTVSSISGTIADGASNAMSNFVPSTNLAANKAIVIDTTAPSAPTISSPSAHAKIISTTSTASGSCETGATVSIANAHLSTNPTTTTCSGGTFSVDISWLGSANNVSQTLTFTQTDLAGNTSAESSTVIVDYATQTGSGGGSPGIPEEGKDEQIIENINKKNTSEQQSAPEQITLNSSIVGDTNEKEETHTSIIKCNIPKYTTETIRLGRKNNPEQVKLLEQFLNRYENAHLEINGIYEKADFDAVIRWQEKYADDILKPWGLKKGTGYVYTRSLAKIKALEEASCPTKKEDSTQTEDILNKENDTK